MEERRACTDLVDEGGQLVDAGLDHVEVAVKVDRCPRQRRQTGTQKSVDLHTASSIACTLRNTSTSLCRCQCQCQSRFLALLK